MIVAGTCMAPEIPDGTLLVFDRTAPVRAGDLVALHFRPEILKPGRSPVAVKRMMVLPPPGFRLPWHDRAGANVQPVAIVEQTNPRQTITIFLSDLVAIHRCLGPAAGAPVAVS